MAGFTPLRSGFRQLVSSPGLVLAEIAWRWGFGFAVCAVLFYSALTFLSGIRISDAEWKLLHGLQPYSTAMVIAHILAELQPVLGRWISAVFPALALLWVLLASVGRAATLKALLSRERTVNWVGMLGINILRVAVTVAAVLAFFGGSILIGVWVRPPAEKSVLPTLLVLLTALVVGLLWSMLNWFLSLAPIFTVRDGRGTFASIGDSLELFRSQPLRYSAIAAGLGTLRALLLAGILLASLAALGAGAQGQWRPALWFAAVVSLLYFAAADLLHIWRIAAYVSLVEPDIEPEPTPALLPPQPVISLPPLPLGEAFPGANGDAHPGIPEGQ